MELNCTGGLANSDDEDKKECNASADRQPPVEDSVHLEPSWRVLKPRMSLAVLNVSLQHIVAHSKSRTASVPVTNNDGDVHTEDHPAVQYAARSLSLEERIHPDR